jgi:acyl-ACP thioesterase
VRRRDIDPMGHVNNAVYLDWVEDSLASTGRDVDRLPRSMRLEYVASAGPSDEVVIEVAGTMDAWAAGIRRDGADLVRASGRLGGRTPT